MPSRVGWVIIVVFIIFVIIIGIIAIVSYMEFQGQVQEMEGDAKRDREQIDQTIKQFKEDYEFYNLGFINSRALVF